MTSPVNVDVKLGVNKFNVDEEMCIRDSRRTVVGQGYQETFMVELFFDAVKAVTFPTEHVFLVQFHVCLLYTSFTLKPCFVAVETQGEFTSGTTVVDIDGCLGKPANVQVALDLDVKGFQQWVAEVLALAL